MSRFHLSLRMILAAQRQSVANLVLLPQGVEDVAPQFDFAQHCPIANTVEAFLGTRQGYTDAIGNVQKANYTPQVAANQRQQNNVILFPLVLVHDVHFDPCELFGRHKVAQAVELPGIGCEDASLALLGLHFICIQVYGQHHFLCCFDSLLNVSVLFAIFATSGTAAVFNGPLFLIQIRFLFDHNELVLVLVLVLQLRRYIRHIDAKNQKTSGPKPNHSTIRLDFFSPQIRKPSSIYK
ncbi:hypothetical protein EYF80_011114 [Liparis tanakae]|uniref:Uncharacterized protein n=1 Tax=Liparis tanakae TaxID=230148 RepID=A0A4Z2IKZ0_9TELE|nr:hypothetical protein EYF80_011114 [Liparis tanakae]